MKSVSMCLFMAVPAIMAHKGMLFDVNPELGVPGFPDCFQSSLLPTTPSFNLTETEALANLDLNAKSLVCRQKTKDSEDQIAVACVGDSITAGYKSSGAAATYPSQLGDMLGDAYKVTNLGACGSTMMKGADSPYWTRPQFTSLTSAKWDIVVLMLGTNDAKTFNWPKNCTNSQLVPDLSCPFAQDFADFIKLLRTLGTTADGPKIYLAVPPPLMQNGAYAMNQTVINDVFPVLVPAINKQNQVGTDPINVFDALGGADEADFPADGCRIDTPPTVAKCPLFCDKQSCDECHPNDNGYAVLAAAVKSGLGL